jgi:O-antigen ligase
LGLLLGMVFVGVVLWPQEALMHGVGMLGVQILGVVPSWSANGVGDLSAALALVALARLQTRGWSCAHRTLYCSVLVVSLATLILAQTRSAILGMLAGWMVVFLLSKRIGIMGWLIAGIGGLVIFAGNTALTYLTRDQNTELLMSLTGRTSWWEAALVRIVDHPILGYGAYAGARFVALADLGNSTTSTIHNTYLDALIGTGLLGLVPLIAALVWSWIGMVQLLLSKSLTLPERQLGIEAMALLALMTVRSFFTSNFIYHAPVDFFLVIGFVEFHRRRSIGRLRPAYPGNVR